MDFYYTGVCIFFVLSFCVIKKRATFAGNFPVIRNKMMFKVSCLKASVVLLLLFSLPVVHVRAVATGAGGQGKALMELNESLAEQNRALVEQNQALAEEVEVYDRRIADLETALSSLQKYEEKSDSVHRRLPFFTYANSVLALIVAVCIIVFFLYYNRRSHIFRKLVNDHENVFRIFRNDKERVERVREELERKMAMKEHELRAEISAMSVALTAVQRMNEAKLQSLSEHAAQEEGVDLFPGEGYLVLPEQDAEKEPADEEKSKISSDACFAALSTMFIRNEQRMVAVDGGVSITTANKWLDAWERNGWVEKVSRGKYMKTSRGKRYSKVFLQKPQE